MASQFFKPAFNDILTTFINSEYQKMFNVIDNYQFAFPLPDGLHLLKRIRNCFVQDVCVLSVTAGKSIITMYLTRVQYKNCS